MSVKSLGIPSAAHVCGDCGNRHECRTCNGRGQVPGKNAPAFGVDCPECDGSGRDDCNSCGNLGYIREDDEGPK